MDAADVGLVGGVFLGAGGGGGEGGDLGGEVGCAAVEGGGAGCVEDCCDALELLCGVEEGFGGLEVLVGGCKAGRAGRGRAYLEYHGDWIALLELLARKELVQEPRARLPPVARKVEVEVVIERRRQRRRLGALGRRRCPRPLLSVAGSRRCCGHGRPRLVFCRCRESGGLLLLLVIVLVLAVLALPPVQFRRVLRYPHPLVPD